MKVGSCSSVPTLGHSAAGQVPSIYSEMVLELRDAGAGG